MQNIVDMEAASWGWRREERERDEHQQNIPGFSHCWGFGVCVWGLIGDPCRGPERVTETKTHFNTTPCLWGQADTVCMLRLCAGFGANRISRDAQDGVSSKGVNEGEMLLLLHRGYTHLSAPLWLTTQNVFSTKCVSVYEWVSVRESECVKKEWLFTWNIFIECIIMYFFQDSIREL